MNTMSLRQSRFVSIMLGKVEQLIKDTPPSVHDLLRRELLQFDVTQHQVAEKIAQIELLSYENIHVIRSYVAKMARVVLTNQERNDRYLHMQKKVSAASLNADYDRSACGAISGKMNAELWRQNGYNYVGHALWTDAELEGISELLSDSRFLRSSGAYKGTLDKSAIAREFISRNPDTERTFDAVRKCVRMQLQQLQESLSVDSQFCEIT